MLKQFTIFFILSGFGATCLAAEDHLLRASFAHLEAGYRIEPQLSDSDLCQPSGCDYTVYEGIAEVVIELDDETSRLRDMWFLVNGEQISNTDVFNTTVKIGCHIRTINREWSRLSAAAAT